MENNQSPQQQPSELSNSWQARSSRREIALAPGWNFLLELLHRPRLVLSGAWVFLIAIAAIAAFSLTNTRRVEQQQTTPTPIAATNPAKTSSQTGIPLRLWLLGAVAFTCAAGSLVIYKRLNRSSQPRQLRLSAQSSSAPVLTRHSEQKLHRLEPQPPVPTETEPVVTAVAPEESDSLDSGSESLAEIMDIRKQRSLSSILRD